MVTIVVPIVVAIVMPPLPVLSPLRLAPLVEIAVIPVRLALPADIEHVLVAVPPMIVAVLVIVHAVRGAAGDRGRYRERQRGQE